MSRSFGIVENKVNETAFFLEKIREEESTYHLDEPQFYLSAFMSACRSITFALQSSLSDLDGFSEWYEIKQKNLRANKLAKFFLISRNESQKIGYFPIGGGASYRDDNGNDKMRFYFQKLVPTSNDYIPEEDVVTACEMHFKNVLTLILEVFLKFGNYIDSKQFFTLENMKKLNLTIEDFEEQAGFPRGYLNVGYGTLDEKIEILRNSQPPPNIDRIFIHYLGKNRFGEKIES